ncbi:uncharacterized protein LOC142176289 [Nicotiana tabacum]|uniref:Uncharacterized protein LOC142176289 n=1 Tax=Nicotiana tabacum TaxID=4097 RepID=A0AC58TQL5_TOBAC
MLMTIKLVVGGFTWNLFSAYAPQAGLDEEVKRRFWEYLDDMVPSIMLTENLFIGGDFNSHIGATSWGYDDVHGDFGFRDRNGRGMSLLDFARAFDLVITKSSFPKKREAAREVLGVSKHYSGGHKRDWWWNEYVQGKVETKKAAYLKLVESVNEEEKRANRENYKLAKKEAK